MAEIRILNGNPARLRELLGDLEEHVELRPGDALLEVDVEKDADTTVSRAVFERLITSGYSAFAVSGEPGRPSEIVREYDPAKHPRVLMVAMLVGG